MGVLEGKRGRERKRIYRERVCVCVFERERRYPFVQHMVALNYVSVVYVTN